MGNELKNDWLLNKKFEYKFNKNNTCSKNI